MQTTVEDILSVPIVIVLIIALSPMVVLSYCLNMLDGLDFFRQEVEGIVEHVIKRRAKK